MYLYAIYGGARWLAATAQADDVYFGTLRQQGLGLSLYAGLTDGVIGMDNHTVAFGSVTQVSFTSISYKKR